MVKRPEPSMTPDEVSHMEDPECGFYIHFVPLKRPYINAHTHGIPESWPEQLDFQLVVNVGPEACHHIFWNLVHRVRAGERFADGQRVDEAIAQHPVLLQETWEARDLEKGYVGRRVLRILLPDANGLLPGDEGFDPNFFPLQVSLDTERYPS